MRRGGGEVGAAIATGRQNNLLGLKAMQFAARHIQCGDTDTAVIFHHQIKGEIFDEKFGFMTQRLTIKRMQNRMSGAVGSGTSALRNAFTEISGHAAKRPLVNFAFFGA